MTDIHPRFSIMAVRALAVLALPASRQLDWLRSLGLGEPGLADEIAQEIGEAAALMPQMVRDGWFSADAALVVQEIDAILAEKSRSENEQFWHVESLSTSEDWERLRGLANQFLSMV
ncbi:MAG: hypothetical protein JWO69_1774 [Thermoleophilia bacterium]|jgi:hypothetical protein|nr:hypothetical protein [Thermoleophilia bacterium]